MREKSLMNRIFFKFMNCRSIPAHILAIEAFLVRPIIRATPPALTLAEFVATTLPFAFAKIDATEATTLAMRLQGTVSWITVTAQFAARILVVR